MEASRSSTPEAPPQDLWSSILDSVSQSRSIPSKQVLILGQESSGKSTIASVLLQKTPSEDGADSQRSDFALGYDWADVRDDGDEDILARLSVYTVPSSKPAYTSLLRGFISPRSSLPHTVVIICLDWTRPWAFIEELQTWLLWVEQWVEGDGGRDLEIVREENRERLQAHLQGYTEPSAEPLPTTSTHSSALLPLGQGTLTHNAGGVPIIVACTKADLIDENSDIVGAGASGMGGMVKGKGGEWEERTDGVMQVLRTMCLKYGASLFYTTPQPTTLQVLRQYALHLLFVPPVPTPGISAGTEAPTPARNPFPFHHKTNTLDRDRIVVPAGWDSWGKIAVLRDGFDAKAWGDAWERDIDKGPADAMGEPGAKTLYTNLVPDQGVKPPPLPPFNNPTAEQIFLAKNYDENAKKPDRDPRGAFKNPVENATAGIVGPMGTSSFSLPHVERALTEMEGSAASNVLGASVSGSDPSRKLSRSTRTVASLATGGGATGSQSNLSRSTGPSSHPLAGSPSPTGGQTQHEVLQNFFQSLLSSKDRTSGAAAMKAAGTSPRRNGTTSPGQGGDTSTSSS